MDGILIFCSNPKKGITFPFNTPWSNCTAYLLVIKISLCHSIHKKQKSFETTTQATRNEKNVGINPYPTAFPYGNGMVLHFYQQQDSSTTKTVHKIINKGLKTYV